MKKSTDNLLCDFTDIFNKLKEYKPKIKDCSVNFYINNIRKINSEIFENPDETCINLNLFKDFEKFKKYIDKNISSISSGKNLVSSVLVLLGAYSCCPDALKKYQEYHKDLTRQREEKYLDNAMSPKEKENWTSRKDIDKKISDMKKEIDKNKDTLLDRFSMDLYQRYLVANLYTLLPPLRNDYALVKIITEPSFGVLEKDDVDIDNNFNYINLVTKKLLLCTYKTRKFYGIKKIDIPDELFDMIVEWEILKGTFFKDNCGYLLINTTTNTPMKTNSLTKYLNKIFFPKKISTTMLRKIYLSEKYPVVVTYRDQAYDAMVMGHSLAMQKMVYSKKI
jgi:hypothetical protein